MRRKETFQAEVDKTNSISKVNCKGKQIKARGVIKSVNLEACWGKEMKL